jgi:hypothetical protein
MARLENDVPPFLGPMIQGAPSMLSAIDCERLTTWLLKTVLMLQLAEPAERRIVRTELYSELHVTGAPSPRLQAGLRAMTSSQELRRARAA